MHLSSYQINRYRLAQLAPGELLTIDEHLTTCAFCRGQMRVGCNTAVSVASLQANLLTEQEDEHLAPAQFVAHLNNRLDCVERELVVSHLASCSVCTAQWQRVLQSSAAIVPRSLVSDVLEFWRERLAIIWTMPVAAVIVLVLVSIADWVYFKPQPTAQPKSQTQATPNLFQHDDPAKPRAISPSPASTNPRP